MIKKTHGSRGQVLPIWVMGTIAMLALSYLVYNYANTVRYEFRVQNGADGMAQQSIMAQSQYFNQMESLLYAANVEEYRIRTLLDGMLLAINGSGGCTNTASTTSTTAKTCNRVYTDLYNQYHTAQERYTVDILMLDSIEFSMNYGNLVVDANATTSQRVFTTCGHGPVGQINAKLDCVMAYNVHAIGTRNNLLAVNHDAVNILVPGYGRSSSTYGVDTENVNQFAPAEVDIVTCDPYGGTILPNFGPFHFPTYKLVGRAAATSAQIEQDFLQPGAVCDPAHNTFACTSTYANFQPLEDFTPTTTDSGNSAINWYQVNYGGNAMTANSAVPAYQGNVTQNEFSATLGWWGVIPIKPFGPPVTTSTQGC